MRFDHFAHPQAFFLLLLLPLLFRFWLKKSELPSIKLSLPANFKNVQGKKRKIPIHLIQTLLKTFALALCVVALARPQSISKSQERKANGIDIVMVMDVSLSMLIKDMGERSRIEVAKQTFKDFIEARTNDRIGFVIFSGEPITLAPPTLDYGLLLQQLRSVEPGDGLKDGTAIGDGLALAINRLKKSSAKSRVIILLTDGDNNVGRIDPITSGELALGYGIKVYSIAFGTEGRVRQPFPQRTAQGTIGYTYVWVENRLNPELLKQISEKTDGKYFRVQDEKTLQAVFKEIDKMEKTQIDVKDKIHYNEEFMSWLVAALLCLLAERLLSVSFWRQWA